MTSEDIGKYNGGIAERLRRFYRGITFQAIILGLVSFTQPGIWVALNSESPSLVFVICAYNLGY